MFFTGSRLGMAIARTPVLDVMMQSESDIQHFLFKGGSRADTHMPVLTWVDNLYVICNDVVYCLPCAGQHSSASRNFLGSVYQGG